jgi:hypothetical protein
MIVMIAFAAATALYSIVRRERMPEASVIGLMTATTYLLLFYYWELYRLGFDQDRWNDI